MTDCGGADCRSYPCVCGPDGYDGPDGPRCPATARYPDVRCELGEGHEGMHQNVGEGQHRYWMPLDQAKRAVLASMERDEPGSSVRGRCMGCGDEFFLADPKARVGATYGFCDSDCEDAYRASLL